MTNPLDMACELSAGLAAGGIAHAVGGAIALGFHAEPRGTLDVDINLFVTEYELEPVLDILARTGLSLDRDEVIRSAADRGDFRLFKEALRVDCFISFHPFHEEVRRRVVRVDLGRAEIPILSAEDLLIFKVLFDRAKDWVDLTNLIAAKGASLDREYIERWIRNILPEDDGRKQRLQELLLAYGKR